MPPSRRHPLSSAALQGIPLEAGVTLFRLTRLLFQHGKPTLTCPRPFPGSGRNKGTAWLPEEDECSKVH
jgi:hypothetical protein